MKVRWDDIHSGDALLILLAFLSLVINIFIGWNTFVMHAATRDLSRAIRDIHETEQRLL
jgi:hypothetical protein